MLFLMNFSSVLEYMSQPYTEAMVMHPYVSYTTYTTSSKEQTNDIITFTQFQGGNLLSKTQDDGESGDKSDDNSIIAPRISKETMDAMDSGNESEYETMSTEMLEHIRGGSKSHPSINRRDTRYEIYERIKQG